MRHSGPRPSRATVVSKSASLMTHSVGSSRSPLHVLANAAKLQRLKRAPMLLSSSRWATARRSPGGRFAASRPWPTRPALANRTVVKHTLTRSRQSCKMRIVPVRVSDRWIATIVSRLRIRPRCWMVCYLDVRCKVYGFTENSGPMHPCGAGAARCFSITIRLKPV